MIHTAWSVTQSRYFPVVRILSPFLAMTAGAHRRTWCCWISRRLLDGAIMLSMATVDASRITRAALRDLQAGRPVKLIREGKAIAALRALPLRPRFDPAAELAAIRKADKGDDWADYLAWPA
jgi:hypothetical protein